MDAAEAAHRILRIVAADLQVGREPDNSLFRVEARQVLQSVTPRGRQAELEMVVFDVADKLAAVESDGIADECRQVYGPHALACRAGRVGLVELLPVGLPYPYPWPAPNSTPMVFPPPPGYNGCA
jgi:hypothetical protein